ncbi:MAG: hypothetical protein IMZ61_11820, partial [Planctomycetes bacterium]|nr:hypothetical protein [Planctomycetota bacterium]
VHGKEQVKRMFDQAPGVFRNEFHRTLLGVNRWFIGDKRQAGIVRRKIVNKRRWIDSKGWRSQVVNLVKGKVVDPLTGQVVTRKGMLGAGSGTGLFKKGISMTLQMGVLYRNKKQIDTALEFLETGGNVSTSKYMPIPVQGGGMAKAFKKFKYWMQTGKLTAVYKNGIALYFLNNGTGERKRDDLKFIGKKNVNVRFNIGLKPSFEYSKGRINTELAGAVERAAKKAEAVK